LPIEDWNINSDALKIDTVHDWQKKIFEEQIKAFKSAPTLFMIGINSLKTECVGMDKFKIILSPSIFKQIEDLKKWYSEKGERLPSLFDEY